MESKQLTQSCLHANCQSLNFYVQPLGKSMEGGGGPNDPLPLGLTSYSKQLGRPRVKSKTNFIDRKSLSNLR